MTVKQSVRCAIYTRKSSEEGLDQSFNSLQAQREACEAYITSQKHEGWHAISAHYDDGGFSGGSMERPALQKLLEDIAARKVHIVVVYKVDRLTRSLADFSKIIEAFDAKGVSFVSVTQQFNTTTSMGRLTLNVLLSFAQFEREVTGERIRDKIEASKKKGMWMGGFVPLGYDVKNRQLIINREEAKTVQEIFRQYVRLGAVSALKTYLDRKGIRSKIRLNGSAKSRGGAPLSRGALYHILNRRLYIGEIAHHGNVYPGQHEAIIDRDTWDKVATVLAENDRGQRRRGTRESSSLLIGILFDSSGNRFTPTHAVKNGKRYRYYTSRATIHGDKTSAPGRIPAQEIEGLVESRIKSLLCSPAELSSLLSKTGLPANRFQEYIDSARRLGCELDTAELRRSMRTFLKRVVVHDRKVSIDVSWGNFADALFGPDVENKLAPMPNDEILTVDRDFEQSHWSNELRLVIPGAPSRESARPTSLIKAIARARSWYDRIVSGDIQSIEQIAAEYGVVPQYVSRILRRGMIPAAIVQSILEGVDANLASQNWSLRSEPVNWARKRPNRTRSTLVERRD